MSNKNNFFVSIWEMRRLSDFELLKIANSENYRHTTRRNAKGKLALRQINKAVY